MRPIRRFIKICAKTLQRNGRLKRGLRSSLPHYGLAIAALSACATTLPPTDVLYSGIPAYEVNRTFQAGKGRAADHPVCRSFYANSEAYISQFDFENSRNDVFIEVAIGAVAGATGGLVGLGVSNSVVRSMLRSTTSSAIRESGRYVLYGVDVESDAGRVVRDASYRLRCPIYISK